MNRKFDVVVIGGGPAGYVAAIRAAQHGLQTACIDAWLNRDGSPAFGGTCLNAGCIPSKALLESSELYHRAQVEFVNHGIGIGELALDLGQMQQRKARITRELSGGIAALLKANKVTGLFGRGHLLPDNKVRYTPHAGAPELLEAEHVILASGSTPVELGIAPFDGRHIVDSWDALEFDQVPERLGVIGAGVIGVELGSVWSRLGAKVTILEAMDRFLFMADAQIAREAQRQFKQQGLDIRLGATVQATEVTGDEVRLRYEDEQGGHELAVDKVVVAVGRRPCTDGLLDPLAGVDVNEQGFIEVDQECRTTALNVWAIGDCVRGPMLAHKGSEEGQLWRHSIDHLYDTGNRLGRQDRRGAAGSGSGLQGRDLQFCGQWPSQGHGPRRGPGQDPGGSGQRRDPWRAYLRSAGRRADRRSRRGDGVPGQRRRSAAYDPWPPDADRGAP